MADRTVRVQVLRKDVFGDLVGNEYSPSSLLAVRDWVSGLLEGIPKEYRDGAKLEIDSVGGYEGEHHVEITVFYDRPESAEEYDMRIKAEKRVIAEQEARERAQFERLMQKYG